MSEQRFTVGQHVRVRQGVTDPDFANASLAGWVGVVAEVAADPPLFLVAWDEETLAAADDELRARCERDGLEWATAWLAADDLEPAPHQSIVPDTPTDDPALALVRMLGGREDEVDLPPVTLERLARFRQRVCKKLKFPFAAGLDLGEARLGSGLRPVMVLRILPAEESLPNVGLMAEVALEDDLIRVPLAVLEPIGEGRAEKDLAAYALWIGLSLPPPKPAVKPTHPFVLIGTALAALGGVCGASLAVVPTAEFGAMLGASLLGVTGFFAGAWYEKLFRLTNRLPPGQLGGGVLGLLLGAGLGAAAGAAAMAYLGSVPGAVAGSLVWWLLGKFRVARLPAGFMTCAGAALGALALTFLGSTPEGEPTWPAALIGAAYGLLAGVLGATALVGGTLLYLRAVFHYEDEGR